MTIDDEIRAERARQERLKAEGKFRYTCADPEPSRFEKLSILLEEADEAADELDEDGALDILWSVARVARACNESSGLRDAIACAEDTARDLACCAYVSEAHTELIQVAAVCDAWLEALTKEQGQ